MVYFTLKKDIILSAVIDFFKSPNFRRAASDAPSMVGTAGLEQVLGKFLDGKTFADLAIQLSVTSVSLKTGEEVVISEGEVMKAVLATIAIPGVFPTRGDDILAPYQTSRFLALGTQLGRY